MRQQLFSAQELYCMAKLNGEKQVFGIPSGFETIPKELRAAEIERVCNALIEREIAAMDFDGRTALLTDYTELISMICECDSCLTVNYQKNDAGRSDAVIFWRKGNSYLRADADSGSYVFIPEDQTGIHAWLFSLQMHSNSETVAEEITIPKVELIRAKRMIEEKNEDGLRRILLQNGARNAVHTIAKALREEADYLSLLLMDNSGDEVKIEENSWSAADGKLFRLSASVVNYRSCATFTPVNESDVVLTITDVSKRLLGRTA